MKALLRSISVLALMLLCLSAAAVVADPTPFKVTQPDGSSLSLILHGDEFYSWLTTTDGVIVEKGPDGYYRPVPALRPSALQIMERQKREDSYINTRAVTTGKQKFLVILIEFSDLSFVTPSADKAFSNMLNQVGYSANNATGSVYDYFYQNSGGAFSPQFDVIGPIQLDTTYAYYGKQITSGSSVTHDQDAPKALYDACEKINAQGLIDFADYDLDKDGYVDGVFFFFAGYAQSHGGGDDTIWPHASYLSRYNATYNGVRVFRYACASELTGNSGSTMCSIGTFCHEFGHTLGLPDFYDTDYATNGTADHPGDFSLMAGGNYNNSSATPPALSAMERAMLGWTTIPEMTADAQAKSLPPVFAGTGIRIPSKTADEYFILESRGGDNVWDKYIPNGMLVYHVDQSANLVAAGRTAASLWNSKINCYGNHPCYYIVPSGGDGAPNRAKPFPGAYDVSYCNTLRGWDGVHSGYYLYDISYDSTTGTSTFSLSSIPMKRIFGNVYDKSGTALAGVTVAVAAEEPYVAEVSRRTSSGMTQETPLTMEMISETSYSSNYTTTDAQGSFSIDVDETEGTSVRVYAAKDGYYNACSDAFTLETGLRKVNLVMSASGSSPTESDLKKYTDSSKFSSLGYASGGAMGAVGFSPEELVSHIGDTLSTVSFLYHGGTPDHVYLLVDFGNKRVLCEEVTGTQPDQFNTVDIKKHKLSIPAETQIYIGYAVFKQPVEGAGVNYCIAFNKSSHTQGSFYFASYDLSSVKWTDAEGSHTGSILVSATLSPYDNAANQPEFPILESPLSKLGYNYIIAQDSYDAGEVLSLQIAASSKHMPDSVVWYFDGQACESTSVSLFSGEHTIEARMSYADGSKEIITKEIQVR